MSAVPYELSVALTAGFYMLSVLYRRRIHPKLNRFLARPIACLLGVLAFMGVLAGKAAILAAWGIPQDRIVCAKLGCNRVSDWLPIILTIGVCALLEASSQPERPDRN